MSFEQTTLLIFKNEYFLTFGNDLRANKIFQGSHINRFVFHRVKGKIKEKIRGKIP